YGDNVRAKTPSIFWDEALPFLDRLAHVDCPEVNPHPLGVPDAPIQPRTLIALEPDSEAIARIESELERLLRVEAERPVGAVWHCSSTLSVTSFLTFVRDPEEFFWRYVRRVPAAPSPAAQLGVELHRRIEQHARGRASLGGALEEVEESYDLDPGE